MRWIIVDKKVPVVRFKGFTDDWEQRKLTDVASKFMYGLNVASKYYDGTNKYLRITDIDDLSHNLSNKKLTSPDSKDIDESYLLKQNDLLFCKNWGKCWQNILIQIFRWDCLLRRLFNKSIHIR